MNLNLDSLKAEILRYLEDNDFVVFHGSLSDLEPFPVRWNTGVYPDYQMFLHTARRVGSTMIVAQAKEFLRTDLETAYDLAEDAELSYDETEIYRKRLAEYEGYFGFTCRIRLGFNFQNRFYIYEAVADWFEEFEELTGELEDAAYSFEDDVEDDDEDDPSSMGFFSKN